MAFMRLHAELLSDDVTYPAWRDLPVKFVAVEIGKLARDVANRKSCRFRGCEQALNHFEDLRFCVHSALADNVPVIFPNHHSEFILHLRVSNHAQERRKNLVEP